MEKAEMPSPLTRACPEALLVHLLLAPSSLSRVGITGLSKGKERKDLLDPR